MINDKLTLLARYRQAVGFFMGRFPKLSNHDLRRLVDLAVAYYHDPERFA